MTVGRESLSPTVLCDIDQLKNYSGTFYWRARGTLKLAYNYGGTVKPLGDANKQIGEDEGSETFKFHLYGGKLDLSEATGLISFGTNCKILHRGGEYVPQPMNKFSTQQLLTE